MTGADLIKWITDNHAEDLPVMIRRTKDKQKEVIEEKDLEIKVSIAGGDQLQYKKYFMI